MADSISSLQKLRDFFTPLSPKTTSTIRYYASVGDERAGPLYERVASQSTGAYNQGWIYKSLGNFYASQQKPALAQEAFLQGRAILKGSANHFAAEMLLLSARVWSHAGDPTKANEFYGLAEHDGDAPISGLAILDQATNLISQGQHGPARAKLQSLAQSDNLEIVRIVALCRLCYSFYKQSDFDSLRQTLDLINARYAAWQTANPQGEGEWGLFGEVQQARLFVSFVENWKKAPLIVETQTRVPFKMQNVPGQPLQLTKRISLRTFRPAQFTLQTEVPYLKASLTNGAWTSERHHYFEQEVTLEADPALFPESDEELTTNIIITVTGERPYELRVPITITR